MDDIKKYNLCHENALRVLDYLNRIESGIR